MIESTRASVKSDKLKNVSVRIYEHDYNKLREISEKEGLKLATIQRLAIEQYIKKWERANK